jgi:hypothetical protein
VVLGANYARSAPRRRQPRPRAHWCISKPDLQCGSGPRVQFSDDRCALCERGGSRLGDYLSLHGPGRRTVGRKGEVMPTKKSKAVSLPVVDPDAAGIDIGATQIFVAVPPDRDPEPVRCFQTFTVDLERLADWLQKCGIRTVAMESTGVYWIPLFQILEKRNVEVRLVNAYHVKNVPGRKTDVADCQWIQHLHACGLLRGSFRPSDEICAIRPPTAGTHQLPIPPLPADPKTKALARFIDLMPVHPVPRPLQDFREIVVCHLDSLAKRPHRGKARQINAFTDSRSEPGN